MLLQNPPSRSPASNVTLLLHEMPLYRVEIAHTYNLTNINNFVARLPKPGERRWTPRRRLLIRPPKSGHKA